MENPTQRLIPCRVFFITIHSANNLPTVRQLSLHKHKIYAAITFAGAEKANYRKSLTDKENELAPEWDFQATFTLEEESITPGNLPLCIKLYAKRTIGEDKLVGQYKTGLKELFDSAPITDGDTKIANRVEYPLTGKASETNGMLKISYAFGKRVDLNEDALKMRKQTEAAVRKKGKGRDALESLANGMVAVSAGSDIAETYINNLLP